MRLSSSTEWLFFHLWKKNPEMNNQSCPGVFIPDTIIYRWAKPFFWYFTTRDGQILRKTKERVFVENFEEIFMQNKANGGLVAMSLTSSEMNEKNGGSREKIEFEYFDRPGFKDFIYQREKAFGILQKFIEPKGHKNQLIKVSWSPQFCLLSRKTNIHDLRNNRHPINDRVVTYEGSEYLSVSDSISSPILSSDVEQLCINIVKHIQDVSGGNIQISRMVLYFKLDDKNRLWLQFCTNIKVREKYVGNDINEPILKQAKNTEQRVQSPLLKLCNRKVVNTGTDNILKKVNVDGQNYIEQLKYCNDNVCANCEEQSTLYSIKFIHIIESFEHNIYDEETKLIQEKIREQEEEENNPQLQKEKLKKKQMEQEDLFYNLDEDEEDYYNKGSINIPGLILKCWGKITEEKYQELKNNSSWINLTTKVCDSCYLLFTQIVVDSKTERQAKNTQNDMKNAVKEDQNQLFQLKPQKDQNENTKKKEREATKEKTKALGTPGATPQKKSVKTFKRASQVNNQPKQQQKISHFGQNQEQQQQDQLFLSDNDDSQHMDLQKIKQEEQMDSGMVKVNNGEKEIMFRRLSQDDKINTDRNTYAYNQSSSRALQKQHLTSRTTKKKKGVPTYFDPAKIYKNQKNIVKLPNINNHHHQSSMNSSTHSTMVSMRSSSQIHKKNDVNFMLNTIQDLKNVLNQEFSVQEQHSVNQSQDLNQQQQQL